MTKWLYTNYFSTQLGPHMYPEAPLKIVWNEGTYWREYVPAVCILIGLVVGVCLGKFCL